MAPRFLRTTITTTALAAALLLLSACDESAGSDATPAGTTATSAPSAEQGTTPQRPIDTAANPIEVTAQEADTRAPTRIDTQVRPEGAQPNPNLPIEQVTIKDRTFNLEVARDHESRVQGLSGRSSIATDGGMLFVFPSPARQAFVMRDCLVDIDIIFLGPTGVVTATHAMKVDPRRDGETNFEYENRIKKYSSRFAAQYAIELQAGMIEKLGVRRGEKITLDFDKLKNMLR